MKIWKLTLWKVSGVNDTLGHILLESLATKDLWERESFRLIPRKSNFVHATNNINVLILVLRISFRTRLCSLTPPISTGPSGPPTGLSSPLSPATFSSGTTKGEGETAAWTADLLSAWDELTSARKLTLSSDILHKLIGRTWLISYYMVDLYFHSWSSFLF